MSTEDPGKAGGRPEARSQQGAQEAKAQGDRYLRQQTDQVADTMDKVADATGAAAHTLAERNAGDLSRYIAQVGDGIGQLSGSLRDKSTDQLIQDASELARRNTPLFVLGSVAVGFGLSRIARAAAGNSETGWEDFQQGESPEMRGAEQRGGATHSATSYTAESDSSAQDPLNQPGAGAATSPVDRGGEQHPR